MIQFTVRSKWQEEDVASRIAEVLGVREAWSRDPSRCPCQRDGKWQLDPGNDWFLNRVEGDRYELRYRYSGSEEAQRMLDGLKAFLEWVFN